MLPIYINRVFTLRLQIYTRHAGHASLLYWMKSVGIVDRGLALRSGLGLLSLLLLCAEYFLNQFGRLLLFSNFLEHFVGDAWSRTIRSFWKSRSLWAFRISGVAWRGGAVRLRVRVWLLTHYLVIFFVATQPVAMFWCAKLAALPLLVLALRRKQAWIRFLDWHRFSLKREPRLLLPGRLIRSEIIRRSAVLETRLNLFRIAMIGICSLHRKFFSDDLLQHVVILILIRIIYFI